MTQEEVTKIADKELHSLAQEYGLNARKWTKKFASLLPEIEKRGLYKQFGFHSVYEYAARICGMSNATVDEILNVHHKLDDKPILQNLITEHGWTKLKIVASSATPENQNFWAEKVKEMSRETLKTFVKEINKQNAELMNGQSANSEQTGLFTDSNDVSLFGSGFCTPMDTSQKSAITFQLDSETETNLRIFKRRLEKETKEPQDWNQVMKKLLEIAAQHEKCGKSPKKCQLKSTNAATALQISADEAPTTPDLQAMLAEIKKTLLTVSKRHIPALVKKYLQLKHGGKCVFPGCKSPADIDHHVRRFALVPTHDPDYIVPLCKNHERIAHHGLIQNEESPPENWQINREPDKSSPKYEIDLKVQKYRAPK